MSGWLQREDILIHEETGFQDEKVNHDYGSLQSQLGLESKRTWKVK